MKWLKYIGYIEFVWWWGERVVCKVIFMSNPTRGYVMLNWVVVELGFWQLFSFVPIVRLEIFCRSTSQNKKPFKYCKILSLIFRCVTQQKQPHPLPIVHQFLSYYKYITPSIITTYNTSYTKTVISDFLTNSQSHNSTKT